MGLIAKLLGQQAPRRHGVKPADTPSEGQNQEPADELAAVERALQDLADERRKAQGEIDARLADRAELLLVDDSDAQIAAIDAACDAQRLILERLDVVEPRLMARLSELRGERRRQQWQEIRQRHDGAVDEFVEAVREALAKRKAMIRLCDDALRAGFTAEASSLIEPLHLLTDEAFEHFLFYREQNCPRRQIG